MMSKQVQQKTECHLHYNSYICLKVQIKTTKCRSPCDLYISKNVSKHYAREKCEHINNKSTIQN